MNQREKEEYLRDYSVLKAQGKPFFPYAVAKDAAMACVVMAIIITMSLVLGAELGSEGEPHHDDLCASSRVVLLLPVRGAARDQAAEPRAAGDDRDPDAVHDPAVPAAVLRSRSRAPARAPAGRDDHRDRRDRRDGVPHLLRRQRRLADGDRNEDAAVRQRAGRRRSSPNTKPARRWWRSPAALPATRSATTATTGPGRSSRTSARGCRRQGIARTLVNPTAPMPSFKNLPREEVQRGRRVPVPAEVASPDARSARRRRCDRTERRERGGTRPRGAAPRAVARRRLGSARGGAGASDVRRDRGRVRPAEHGDDGRAPSPLARARGRSRAPAPGLARARRGDGDRRPGDRAGAARVAWRRGRRQRLRRGDARARASEDRDVCARAGGAPALRVGRRARAALRR